MLNINDKMKKIISDGSNLNLEKKYLAFLDEIVSKTKRIGDCIIYDDEGISESDIDWERVLKFVGDFTGYEVACNEFRLEKSECDITQCQKLAHDMHSMLQNKYKEKQFVVYVYINDGNIDVRFHTYRITEGFWVKEDLNGYDNPILWIM